MIHYRKQMYAIKIDAPHSEVNGKYVRVARAEDGRFQADFTDKLDYLCVFDEHEMKEMRDIAFPAYAGVNYKPIVLEVMLMLKIMGESIVS